MYATWYGFGRMFIEGLRTDSLYVGVFRISQVVGFLCFVIGAILLIVNLVKARRKAITDGGYEPTYAKISHYGATTVEDGERESEAEDAEEQSEEETDGDAHIVSEETIENMENKFRHLFDTDEGDKSKED